MPIPQLQPTDKNDGEDRRFKFQKTWRDIQDASVPDGPRPLWRRALTALHAPFRYLRRRHNAHRKNLRAQLLRFWLPLTGIIVLFGIFSIVVAFAWFSRDLPDPEKISDRSVAQSTRIYARDGKTLLYEIHGDEKRTVVDLADIAPNVVNATIAIEDKDFYKHKGVSLTGIVRAIWRDVTTGSTQGGSTITQQFVKNAILTSEKRITRKVREWVLSYQIERRFTKQQILKLYFNEIPYGSNAYGIEAASEMYFGKPAKSLSLAESAVLAAIPQAPTFYSPYGNNTDRLIGRSRYVLDLMAEQGYITKNQAEEAKNEDVLKNVKPKRETIIAPHFVFYLRDLLTQKYGEKLVERGGLRVVSTLDIDKQLAAEQSVNDQASTNEKKWNASNAALVSIDPKTGQVLAMIGSRDYFNADIDGNVNVALTLQQPGSSIKPIVYATAFSRGFTPETILFDLTTKFKIPGSKDFVPHNYDGKEHGPVSMRSALAGSLNIPAVKTLYLAGIDHVIDQAQKMGYTTWEDRSRFGLSLVLGGADVKLIEHTAAFGALATDGTLHTTTPILRVEDKSGKVLEEFKDQSGRVIDENAARQVNSVLSDNNARAFIFGERNRLTLPDRAVAAKTGTTQEYRDAWTMGFTSATGKGPAIVTGVWVGNNQNTPMKAGADGSVIAAPIWNSFMRKAVAGTKAEAFKKPKISKPEKPILRGVLEGDSPIKVDTVTGKEIPTSCVDTWPKEFVLDRTVKAVHTILFYVDPADPTGPAPKNPAKNLQFASWDEPIQQWAKKNGYIEQRPAKESCDLRTKGPAITIQSPSVNATVREGSVTASFAISSPRPVTAITFFLDNVQVGVAEGTATSTTISLQDTTNGFHTIKIVAQDDIGTTSQSSVDINVLRDATQSTTYFIDPAPGTNATNATPLTIRAFAFDPAGIASVTFRVVRPDGSSADIATVTTDDSSIATTSWLIPPTAGAYRLSILATTKNGGSLQSDTLTLTVN